MLKTLYAHHQKPDHDLSFQDVLLKVRDILAESKYTQIPQLTSSRPLDVTSPFEIVPDGNSGTKRAVIIGINYVGQQGELSGCQNDAKNMAEYIKDVWGFEESNITFLMDDGQNPDPTMENILNAFKQLVSDSEPGDVAFVHYSGHGGKVRDDNGDEGKWMYDSPTYWRDLFSYFSFLRVVNLLADGYDETLVPLDYQQAGQIRDDDLFTTLVGAMPRGAHLTCVMDCCHSGTVLDLPYQFVADGEHEQMEAVEDFNFSPLLSLAQKIFGGGDVDGGELVQGLMGLAKRFS